MLTKRIIPCLDRVAGVDEIDEIGAFDDAAVGDVEAGDDTFGEHFRDGAGVGRQELGGEKGGCKGEVVRGADGGGPGVVGRLRDVKVFGWTPK